MRLSDSLLTSSLLAALAATPMEAHAETVGPPTFQGVVDEFGLDMKTGRFSYEPPPIISIGGADGLSVSYSPSGGRGLIHNFYREIQDVEVTLGGSQRFVTIQFGQLSETFLGQTSQGPFTPEYATGSSLVWVSPGYLKYTDRMGMEIHFESSRTRVTYPDGREMTVHGFTNDYNGGMMPTAVTNNFGYMIKFAAGVSLQAVNQTSDYCNPAVTGQCSGLSQTRTASAEHGGSLRNLTDAAGNTTVYRLRSILAPAFRTYCYSNGYGVVCVEGHETLEYYLAGITFPGRSGEDVIVDYGTGPWDSQDGVYVKSITRGDATVNYQIAYTNINVPPEASMKPYHLKTTAYVGGQFKYESLATNPNGGFRNSRRSLEYTRDMQYRFNNFRTAGAGQISGVRYPEGNEVSNGYDARNNVISSSQTAKPDSGLATILTSWTYAGSCTSGTQATCNKPLTYTDGRNNTTDYTYNSRGQILTETGPAPTTGAARPKTTYTYTMRTAYIKNSSGAAVAAGPPISLLTRKSSCRTSSSCAGTTDEVVTEYDYGPTTGLNNLRLRGITVTAANASGQIQTLRTCYTYNYFGERISETKPNANLGSCS